MVRAIVIGGGATGAGVLRDLAMRGIPAALVERGDLVSGTSSRYHGLLHSGGRYAVKDRESAEECARENAILRRIAEWAIEPCGGLFVQLKQDDPSYAEKWVPAAKAAGIPVEPVDPDQVRREVPGISPNIVAAYRVPDAAIDAFRLITANVAAAQALGAKVYTYRKVIGMLKDGDRVVGVRMLNQLTGEEEKLEAEIVINAAGPWSGQVAALAGIHEDIVPDRGVLLVYHGRLCNQVINRLRPPGNADIFVPTGTITMLGTTATPVDDPDNIDVPPEDVEELMRLGAELLPAAATARIVRAFAGCRPLYKPKGIQGDTRNIPRTYVVIDHEQDGVPGLVSILGGKLTTYREMAEKTVDIVAKHLGVTTPCRTAEEPILPPPDPEAVKKIISLAGPARSQAIIQRHPAELNMVAEELARPHGAEVLCECEQVTVGEILATAKSLPTPSLADIRKRTRMGMGTCQGAFCGYRAILAMANAGIVADHEAETLLLDFQAERWRGIASAFPGTEMRAAEMTYALYSNLLGPLAERPVERPVITVGGGSKR
ncbi:MAG TPA: anaerobic glycerol-3-phosphate dehydrogenase subunit GlpA [Symbiobacteriaceae bacterium]